MPRRAGPYIAVRFDVKGAVAAVIAVFHDILVCPGALSLTLSLPVLAALLTIIGYQVNDTIVAYDRLRENRSKLSVRGKSFAEQMNDAINQTLSRTVLTALTVFAQVPSRNSQEWRASHQGMVKRRPGARPWRDVSG
jgi:preprotein translocase SecF subunit